MGHVSCIAGQVRFDGKCEETRPACGAICCKNVVVLLTEEEKTGGRYDFVGPTPNCNCKVCQLLISRNAVSLRRKESGCVYLDGSNKCSIYENRPAMCRDFNCPSTFWGLNLSSQHSQAPAPSISESIFNASE